MDTSGLTNGMITFSNINDAQDATFTLNGIWITKDTNTVTDVLIDTTISLETIGSGTISFDTDYDGILGKVQEFADAYNEVMDHIKNEFQHDQGLDEKGVLFGSNALQTIQNQLRSIVSNSIPDIDSSDTDKLSFLSQAGIKTNDTNHLEIDEGVFVDALKDRFSDVECLFSTAGSGSYTFVSTTGGTTGGTYNTRISGGVFQMQDQDGNGTWIDLNESGGFVLGVSNTTLEGLILEVGTLNEGETGTIRISVGVAERVSYNTALYTEFSTSGLIFNQNSSIEDQDKELQLQIDDLEERIAKKEEDLKAKFVNLEVLLSQLSSEQEYLTSQLASLAK